MSLNKEHTHCNRNSTGHSSYVALKKLGCWCRLRRDKSKTMSHLTQQKYEHFCFLSRSLQVESKNVTLRIWLLHLHDRPRQLMQQLVCATKEFLPKLSETSRESSSACSSSSHAPCCNDLNIKNIKVLARPAHPPHTSPTEHVWDALDQRAQQHVAVPANIEPHTSTEEEWTNIFHRQPVFVFFPS